MNINPSVQCYILLYILCEFLTFPYIYTDLFSIYSGDWRWEEKGTTEDEMVRWHHQLNGRESEYTLGVGDRQGGLACCSPWGRKEPDMTKWLDWTELNSTSLTPRDYPKCCYLFPPSLASALYLASQPLVPCQDLANALRGKGRELVSSQWASL